MGQHPEVFQERHQAIAPHHEAGHHVPGDLGEEEVRVHHGEQVEHGPDPLHPA